MKNGEGEAPQKRTRRPRGFFDEIYRIRVKLYKGKAYTFKNTRKEMLVLAPESKPYHIPYHKILLKRKRYIDGLPKNNRKCIRLATQIFDFAVDKMLDDMIENKTVLKLHYNIELSCFIEEFVYENGRRGIIALDTTKSKSAVVRHSIMNGYRWIVNVPQSKRDRMDDRIFIEKETYTTCSEFTGKQSLVSSKEKCRRLLMSKLKKKG